MSKRLFSLLISVLSVWCVGCFAATPPTDPEVEVGSIKWGRDLDQAKKAATASGKPLMLLFQEVPG